MTDNINTIPLVPLRGIVIYPYNTITFDAGRDISVKAAEAAYESGSLVLLVTQRDTAEMSPSPDALYTVGTVSKIKQIMRLPGGNIRVLAEGLNRGVIKEYIESAPFFTVTVDEIIDPCSEDTELDEAYKRSLKRIFKEYFSNFPKLKADMLMQVMSIDDLPMLCDVIAHKVDLNFDVKQHILEEFDIHQRAEKLLIEVQNYLSILNIEYDIARKVKKNMDKNQREYYLREQLKVIHTELGDDDEMTEIEEYKSKIAKIKAAKDIKDKLLTDVDRLSKMPFNSSESAVIRTYLDTVLSMPWNKSSKETFELSECRKTLDEDHYGLEKVKERVLEYLTVRKLTNGKAGTILCLAGPPGVGKTSVAKSVARALNRKCVRISLGGIRDESDIRGHRKTYIGAMEGRIMAAMREAGVKNPLLLLDEIDKMGTDFRGDPSAALLEVLDSEQNMSFRDHYMEVPFDLSQVLFITTANTLDTISAPLLDRLEIIELNGYTAEEKFHIAKRYLLPKAIDKTGISNDTFSMTDGAVRECIESYTREAGVRKLEQQLEAVCRKAATKIVENGGEIKVTKNNLTDFLGKKRYHFDMLNERDEIGVARGLAWTSVGGDTLSIETNVMPGTGKIELTGKLGDVMQESAKTAISYIRSKSEDLNIESDFYKTKDIHIHVPEGAVPKDGPSAGITMATALVSSLTERPVKRDVAMTGEITLRGRVLPIGGLKEKTLAAYRAGIDTIIIPEENKPDLDDIPSDIRSKMNFIPASNMETVLKNALR
ncbi:MAG: endopeptidase La [Firmicutes bacterium]|nr:endopeptidase La [Bacillota bacterium]